MAVSESPFFTAYSIERASGSFDKRERKSGVSRVCKSSAPGSGAYEMACAAVKTPPTCGERSRTIGGVCVEGRNDTLAQANTTAPNTIPAPKIKTLFLFKNPLPDIDQRGDHDPNKPAGEDLFGAVAKQFLQAVRLKALMLIKVLQNLVQGLRLLAALTAHALRVKHRNHKHREYHRKKARIEPIKQPHRSG